ncbi:MAG: hypothetical protein ILNGONEN_02524 [Syntrophorhabdaceae bacterium]|nr:hypothetical protein [Syntrophorhabdaceae bacterium]
MTVFHLAALTLHYDLDRDEKKIMVTVKVIWQDTGKPAKDQRVSIGFDGWTRGVTGDEYTDSNGETHFDVDPGSGKIYVSGSPAYSGHISGRVVIYI